MKNLKKFSDSNGLNNNAKKLKSQLKYVIKNSPFYKKKIVKHDKILHKNFNFEKLPFTTKQELLNDQKQFPPYGSNLCVPFEKIKRVHRTSGTTNDPLIIALTGNDIKKMAASGAVCARTAGLKKTDTVVHCLNYSMWMGGYTDHQILESAGAAVIPFGVGNSKQLIEIILRLGVTTISSTPSYLNKLTHVLKEHFDIKPRQLGLKLGLLGTEGGLQDPEYRKNIEETWGIKAINFNFGLAEVWSIFGSECFQCQKGLNFISEGNLFIELIDPSTKKTLEIEENSKGEMVITHLNKEAQPLVRYRTGDIIEIASTKPCSCGIKSFKFNVIGRSDDMITIKGLNVFPEQIRGIINKHLKVLSGEFQIILEKPSPIDNLYIKIERSSSATSPETEMITGKLINEFKNLLFITPTLDFVPHGSLTEEGTKGKYINKIYSQ